MNDVVELHHQAKNCSGFKQVLHRETTGQLLFQFTQNHHDLSSTL